MKTLAVICQKTSYLRQLLESIPGYLPREWTVSGFETKESFLKEEGIAKVLLADVAFAEREAFVSKNRKRFNAALWLTDSEAQGADEVFMFRSVSEIAERVLAAAAGPEPRTEPSGNGGGFQVIGYIGAEGNSGCTTEAYRKAVRLAAEGKTAFLCLDNSPGLKELLAAEDGVSELMYLLKEYGAEWVKHTDYCEKQIAGVSVFAGVARIGDATEFRENESECFVNGLRDLNCRNLVIDFGTNGTEELLLQCDTVYVCGGRNSEKRKALEAQAAHGGFADRLRPATAETARAGR